MLKLKTQLDIVKYQSSHLLYQKKSMQKSNS